MFEPHGEIWGTKLEDYRNRVKLKLEGLCVWRILGLSLDETDVFAPAVSPTDMTAGCPAEGLVSAELVGEA